MNYIKQFTILVAVCFIGEILHHLIPLPVPASIYGLVLMFCALHFKIMPLESVEKVSDADYIFSEKGVLYKSAKKKIVTVKGKKYLVKKNGKACVGTVIIDGKFYISGKTGKYLSDKSKKLRKAAKANKPMTPVYQLIGKPKKSQYENGCYSMKDPKTGKYISGKDGILTYQNIYVYTMKAADGREFFIGAESKE